MGCCQVCGGYHDDVRLQEYMLSTIELCLECDTELTKRLFAAGSVYRDAAVEAACCPGQSAYIEAAGVVARHDVSVQEQLRTLSDWVRGRNEHLVELKYAAFLLLWETVEQMREARGTRERSNN